MKSRMLVGCQKIHKIQTDHEILVWRFRAENYLLRLHLSYASYVKINVHSKYIQNLFEIKKHTSLAYRYFIISRHSLTEDTTPI